MILYQDRVEREYRWFSWDTKTMKHYYPKGCDYKLLGPTKWNLKHNLRNGTTTLGPDIIGGWLDD